MQRSIPRLAAALAAAVLAGIMPAPAAAQAELGRNLAATCANCHGTGGVSVNAVFQAARVLNGVPVVGLGPMRPTSPPGIQKQLPSDSMPLPCVKRLVCTMPVPGPVIMMMLP